MVDFDHTTGMGYLSGTDLAKSSSVLVSLSAQPIIKSFDGCSKLLFANLSIHHFRLRYLFERESRLTSDLARIKLVLAAGNRWS